MKMKLKSSLLAGLSALALLLPAVKDNSLKDIAKPYIGVYECKHATLGSTDVLSEFSTLTLELTDAEHYVLYYQRKTGKKEKQKGRYRYDKEQRSILLTANGVERTFPLVNGRLIVVFPVGGKEFVLHFEQK